MDFVDAEIYPFQNQMLIALRTYNCTSSLSHMIINSGPKNAKLLLKNLPINHLARVMESCFEGLKQTVNQLFH